VITDGKVAIYMACTACIPDVQKRSFLLPDLLPATGSFILCMPPAAVRAWTSALLPFAGDLPAACIPRWNVCTGLT
jgi:hypothetical protein